MSLSPNKVPLGAVLQQAGLVSGDRVKEALQEQRQSHKNLRIGEILASKGYISSTTADFFAERWSGIIRQETKQPIGQYLKQAALLDESQIQTIVDAQKQSQLKFGELAIAKGWLKQATVDYFLRCLALKPKVGQTPLTREDDSKLESPQQVHEGFYKIKLRLLNLEEQDACSQTVLTRVLYWTGGQSYLTQKLFKLIAHRRNKLVSGKEAEQVNYIVQTKILNDWRDREAGEHLQTIENRLLNNQRIEPIKLLRLYQRVLNKTVVANRTQPQQELLKTGLVVKQHGQLVVANRIYQSIFDPKWVEQQLTNLNKDKAKVVAVPQNIAKVPSRFQNNKSFQLKNLFLLLALIGLLLLFFNNIFKRIAVRNAFERGNKLLKQKSFDDALTEYNRLLNIDSNYYQAWTNRGYALAGLQQYDQMRESCLTATIIEPTAVYAWNCKGEALHNLQREAEAIAAFNRAIAILPKDPIFSINKSESLNALGRNEESLVTIKSAIQVLEDLETIEGKEKISGEFAVALTFLGNGYRQKEQYQSALFNYNRALGYVPNYFPALVGKGIVLNQIKKYSEAEAEFKRILELEQLSPIRQAQTWFYLGKTLCNSQQTLPGIAALEKAIKIEPGYQAAEQAKQQCS